MIVSGILFFVTKLEQQLDESIHVAAMLQTLWQIYSLALETTLQEVTCVRSSKTIDIICPIHHLSNPV